MAKVRELGLSLGKCLVLAEKVESWKLREERIGSANINISYWTGEHFGDWLNSSVSKIYTGQTKEWFTIELKNSIKKQDKYDYYKEEIIKNPSWRMYYISLDIGMPDTSPISYSLQRTSPLEMTRTDWAVSEEAKTFDDLFEKLKINKEVIK